MILDEVEQAKTDPEIFSSPNFFIHYEIKYDESDNPKPKPKPPPEPSKENLENNIQKPLKDSGFEPLSIPPAQTEQKDKIPPKDEKDDKKKILETKDEEDEELDRFRDYAPPEKIILKPKTENVKVLVRIKPLNESAETSVIKKGDQ